MTVPAPRRIVSYPPRSLDTCQLGFDTNGQLDNAHNNLALTGGASILRAQFGWETIEDYTTGNLSLSTSGQGFLTRCATNGIQPLLVAAYGPPRATIGTLTVSSTVANGSPAGTSIPVNSYGFSINANSTDFAGGLFFGGGLTGRSAYYGDIITHADASSIQIGAALTSTLNTGATINIQRLRYEPPTTDTDPSIAAYVRYVVFLANQIAAAGCTGWIDVWNEYVWAHDRWSEMQQFYDSPPGSITLTSRMNAILIALQAATLPVGVRLVNGVTDKSANNAVPIAGGNFTHNSWHPYGNNPEDQSWTYYGYGTNGQHDNPSGLPAGATWNPSQGGGDDQWEALIRTQVPDNFRGMGFLSDQKPSGPWPGTMVTESGLAVANNTQQAQWNVRRLLNVWGLGSPCVIFSLDSGAGDTAGYSVAPGLTPRLSYTGLQRIMEVLGRMDSTSLQTTMPQVVGWSFDDWPLMVTTTQGRTPGNWTMFLWQRTFVDDATLWTTIAAPPARPVSIYLPTGLSVQEAVDTITGSVPTITGPTNSVITVPITDNPVAIRFSP